MPAKVNIAGVRFGELVALAEGGVSPKGEILWLCACDCGGASVVGGYDLRSGHTTSCGCGIIRGIRRAQTTHGLTRSPEWRSWNQMRRRCQDERAINFGRYGGRGIAVCDRWADSFENFLADMGLKPSASHTIDRIDPDGDYEPNNCRWATKAEQSQNRRKRDRAEMKL